MSKSRSKRIELLEKYLEQEPDDPFNKYALALEYTHENKTQASVLFDELLLENPDYGATYYHAAALQALLGNREKASAIYTKGISVLTNQEDANALRELKNAFQNFEFEDD